MVNVNSESVIAQKVEKEEAIKKAQEKKTKFNVEFDEKHYLNTRLSKGEDKREIVVRLLPFSEKETSPFKKVYVHSVKITNEKGEKQWKKFMCPEKMGKSDGCPFCETAARARQLRFDSTDELKKAQYKDQEFMNSVKEYWLVRCIERGHEEDGVKFWRFADARNGEGIWDKIYDLFETKKKRGVEIFDLYKGKDLVITVKRQVNGEKEKLVYQIQDDEMIKPLSESEEQMEKWVNDSMTWEDVYSVKDYDYLSLIVLGEYPVWDKNEKKWVAKSSLDSTSDDSIVEDGNDIGDDDLSKFSVDITDKKSDVGPNVTVTIENSESDNGNSSNSEEYDDLPF